MQQPIAACTRAQSLTRPCPCATCNWLLHPAPTSAQDGHDPPQLALVVFSCHQLLQRPHLHLQSSHLQISLMVFFLYQLAHLLTCAHDLPCCHYPPLIALAVVFPLPTKHLLMCTHAHEHVLQLALYSMYIKLYTNICVYVLHTIAI